MDVTLKVTENLFDEITNSDKKIIRHGYSKNKKYQRLFENNIENITLISCKEKRSIIKQFKSIQVLEIEGKKIIEITIL